MNIYFKIVTLITVIAFTLIKKANFRLDPDNIGLNALLAVLAIAFNYFSGETLIPTENPDLGSELQSAILTS